MNVDIEARFRAQNAQLLIAAGCGPIVFEQDRIEVSIVEHLTHRETAIPDCWEPQEVSGPELMWRITPGCFRRRSSFAPYRRLSAEDQDYTDLMTRKLAGAEPHNDPEYLLGQMQKGL
jgi:hypothetical protein